MSDPTLDPIGRGWRLVVVVLACLVALALPYLVVNGLVDRGSSTDLSLIAGPLPASATSTSTSTSTSGPSTAATASAGETGADQATASQLATATEACRLASLRVATALSAADVSLAQFDKHIDAMNLLVAGRISLAVATQFWEETRVGAVQNSEEYQRALRVLSENRTCAPLPAAVAAELPHGEVERLDRCIAYVSGGTSALGKATTAVQTWIHHIHDMEKLRKGDITPAQASAAWKRDWRTGEKQLAAFQAARKQATSADCTLR